MRSFSWDRVTKCLFLFCKLQASKSWNFGIRGEGGRLLGLELPDRSDVEEGGAPPAQISPALSCVRRSSFCLTLFMVTRYLIGSRDPVCLISMTCIYSFYSYSDVTNPVNTLTSCLSFFRSSTLPWDWLVCLRNFWCRLKLSNELHRWINLSAVIMAIVRRITIQ